MNNRLRHFDLSLALTKVIEVNAHNATSADSVPTVAFLNEKISLATSGRLVLNMFVLALKAKVLAESIARERMYGREILRNSELFMTELRSFFASFKTDL